MLSTTWNATSADFNTSAGFFGERTADDVLLAFHLTQHYVGLQQIPTFSEYNVVKSPDTEAALSRLRQHLVTHGIGKNQ